MEQVPNLPFRKHTLAMLAQATPEEIEAALSCFRAADASDLRGPETGLVMVRGRIGGGGSPFNLGEATVTRASVRLETGEVGHGYALGADHRSVRGIAVLDALFQRDGEETAASVVAPIADRIAAEDTRKENETAATRVDFFTMTRGED